MGFMDKFKGQMDQAQEMAKQAQAGMGGSGGGAADYAQLANELASSGVPCTATIKSIGETGNTDVSGKEYAIEVAVEGNGEPYDATVRQYLIETAVPSYQPGAKFEAKADPDDGSRLLLFGLAG